MVYLLIFIFGSIVGSFLNVCIYRMPREESIIVPGSRCALCKKPIPWYDNIPLISYILLKGKCRFCSQKIAPRYFLVELITAIIFASLFARFDFNYMFLVYAILSSMLIVITFIDLEFQIIPDSISLGGIVLGIIFSAVLPGLQHAVNWKEALFNSFLGILIGGGLVYLAGILGKAAFKKDSMGGGDVKFLAMLGAFLGWKIAIIIFFLAPFFGLPAALYTKFVKKQDIIPYGPYISMAGIAVIFWGDKILKMFIW